MMNKFRAQQRYLPSQKQNAIRVLQEQAIRKLLDETQQNETYSFCWNVKYFPEMDYEVARMDLWICGLAK
jgi:hypothetical protein